MEFLFCLITAVVIGITEWLPVGTTSHLIALNKYTAPYLYGDFRYILITACHLAALLSLIVYLWPTYYPFGRNQSLEGKGNCIRLWKRIALAAVPAGVLGVIASTLVSEVLYIPFLVGVMVIVLGIAMVIVENLPMTIKARKIFRVEYSQAFNVGLIQTAAVVPGTGRFSTSLLGARILGFSKECALMFSFLLSVPMMLGSNALHLIQLRDSLNISGAQFGYIAASCLITYYLSGKVIRWILNYIKEHNYAIFGWYRIITGIIFLLLFYAL